MPGPLALVGGVMALGAISKVGDMFTQSIDVKTIEENQRALQFRPIIVPDIGQIVETWKSRFITTEQARIGLGLGGVAWDYQGDDIELKARSAMWRTMVEHSRPRPDIASTINGRSRGFLDNTTAERLWTYHAGLPDDWYWMYDLLRYWLPPGQISEAKNRGLLAGQEWEKFIAAFGGMTCRQTELLDRLRWQLPPISDVIRFAVKDVFDPQLPGRGEMVKEYPKIVGHFARAQGYGSPAQASDDPAFRELTEDYGLLSWLAHYYPISPSQSYEMLHRLRPDNIDDVRKYVVDASVFTLDDVKKWLKIADYPPAIRANLAAISYSVVTRVDTRRLRKAGIWQYDRVKQSYLDRGYNPADAESLAQWTEEDVTKEKAGPANNRWAKAVRDNYRIGTISRDQAENWLIQYYSASLDPNAAASAAHTDLDAIDLDAQGKLVDRAIRSLRSDFLEGAIDENDTRVSLNNMGISGDRADQYVATWRLDRTHARRAANTQKVIAWYEQGFITREQAIYRLQNLGWSEPDRALYLLEADAAIQRRRQLAEMQAARTEQQKARAQEKALKEQKAQANRARSEFARTSSPAWIRRWRNRKLVSDQEARDWLSIQGWPEDRIDRFLNELEMENTENGTS